MVIIINCKMSMYLLLFINTFKIIFIFTKNKFNFIYVTKYVYIYIIIFILYNNITIILRIASNYKGKKIKIIHLLRFVLISIRF